MEGTGLVLTVILGILLRLGIPIAATILFIYLLKKLDERWQSEAKTQPVLPGDLVLMNQGCWDVKGCSEEMKKNCEAFAHPEAPCWQVFRASNGELLEKCVGCEVFLQAPLPATVTKQRRISL